MGMSGFICLGLSSFRGFAHEWVVVALAGCSRSKTALAHVFPTERPSAPPLLHRKHSRLQF